MWSAGNLADGLAKINIFSHFEAELNALSFRIMANSVNV